MALQIRRGTNAERLTIIPLQGELIYTTDTKRVYVGDGLTAGGILISGSGNGEDMTDEEIQALVAEMFTDGTHSGISFTYNSGTGTINATVTGGGGGSGTVTGVSVASANGFSGSVANSTTTPSITLSTSVTGLLKGNGTAISAAVSGTDYQAPISLTTTGSSGAATLVGNTLNIPQYSGGGSSALGDLTDVEITGTPATGEILKYDTGTSKWVNESLEGSNYKIGITADDDSIILDNVSKTLTINSINSDLASISIDSATTFTSPSIFATDNASTRIISIDQHHDDSVNSSSLTLRRSRGTIETPTEVVSGDVVGIILANSKVSSGYSSSTAIISNVEGTVTSSAAPGNLEFLTANAAGSLIRRLTIDSTGLSKFNGNVVVSTDSYSSNPLTIFTQHHSTVDARNVTFSRSRGTNESPVAVNNNDDIIDLQFAAYDGVQYVTPCAISVIVDATPNTSNGANSTPGRIEFLTNNGTALATRVRIDSTGMLEALNSLEVTGLVDFITAEQTTVGVAGAANALPATPSTYFKIKVNGVEYVVPAYAVS